MNAASQLPLWRRCLQFRLRTLLILVTLSSCAIAGYLRYHRLSNAYGFHRLHATISNLRRAFVEEDNDLTDIQEQIAFHRSQMEECRAAYWRPWRSIPAQVTLPPPRENAAE